MRLLLVPLLMAVLSLTIATTTAAPSASVETPRLTHRGAADGSTPGPFFVLHADETAWVAAQQLIRAAADAASAAVICADEPMRWDRTWVERAWAGDKGSGLRGFGLDVNLLAVAGDELRDAAERHHARAVALISSNPAHQALRQAAAGGASPLTTNALGSLTGVARAAFVPESSALHRAGHMRLCGEPDPAALIRAMRRHADERDRLQAATVALRDATPAVPTLDLDLDAMERDAPTAEQLLAHFLGLGDAIDRGTAAQQKAVQSALAAFVLPIDTLLDCADTMRAARVWLAVQDDSDAPALIAAIDPLLARIKRHRA